MDTALAYQEDYEPEERYELINGKVCMMARPTMDHVQIQGNIFNVFKNYLKGKRCRPFDDGDVFLSKKDNFVPDVMIICNPEIIKKKGIFGAPDLVVEILSPSTANKDRGLKFKTYEKFGVKEYWIVSPEAKTVEVYLLNEGKLEFNYSYLIYPDYEWESLTEEEKAEVKMEIKVSLYDDFYVKLEDIFEDVE